jgi:hypothetical protein
MAINSDIDLQGETVLLKEGITIIPGSGIIKNGVLVGSGTKIAGVGPLFDNVTIRGFWNVSNISSEMFINSSKNNVLNNLFELSSDSIYNVITITPGDYMVSVDSLNRFALKLKSNTLLHIEGRISLMATDISNYSILYIEHKENVKITGTGLLCGDYQSHLGTDGEWGMGIYILDSKNICVNSISINDSWGDAVYIGHNSHNINITNLSINNARRQGISVTSGNYIAIKECAIIGIDDKISGYGIDLEPNEKCLVENVDIVNNNISQSYGGILLYGKANEAIVEKIELKGNTIESKHPKYGLGCVFCNNVKIEDNVIYSDGSAILVMNANGLSISSNILSNTGKGYAIYNINSHGIRIDNNNINSEKYSINQVGGTELSNNIFVCESLLEENKSKILVEITD